MPSRRAFLVVTLLAGLGMARPATADSNKLLNPLFTEGLDDWKLFPGANFAVSYSSTFGKYLPGSMVVTASGATTINTIVATQTVNVVPGAVYSIGSYFWYSPDAATVPTGVVGVSWYAGLGGTGSFLGLDSTLPTNGPAGTWLLAQKTLFAPPQAHSALITLGVTTHESKTTLAVFDDAFVFGGGPAGVIGDVNGDGTIGVDDVFYLVNYLFAHGPLPVGPSDVDGDYKLDVADVFYLVNYLFAGGDPPIE